MSLKTSLQTIALGTTVGLSTLASTSPANAKETPTVLANLGGGRRYPSGSGSSNSEIPTPVELAILAGALTGAYFTSRLILNLAQPTLESEDKPNNRDQNQLH